MLSDPDRREVRFAILFLFVRQIDDEEVKTYLTRLAAALIGPLHKLSERMPQGHDGAVTKIGVFSRIAYAYGLKDDEIGRLYDTYNEYLVLERSPYTDLYPNAWNDVMTDAATIKNLDEQRLIDQASEEQGASPELYDEYGWWI